MVTFPHRVLSRASNRSTIIKLPPPLPSGPCVFKDTMTFMNSGLGELADNLPRSEKYHLRRWINDTIVNSTSSSFDINATVCEEVCVCVCMYVCLCVCVIQN